MIHADIILWFWIPTQSLTVARTVIYIHARTHTLTHTHTHTHVNVIYFVKFGVKLCSSVTTVTIIAARRFPSAHRSLVPSCCLLALWRTVTDIVNGVNELWTATLVLTPHLLRLHMKYCVLQRLFAVSTLQHGVTCIIMCGWKWVDCSSVRLV